MHHGDIAIFYRKAENFTLEALYLHNRNTFIFHLEMEQQRWYVMGCYIVFDDALTIEGVVMDISRRPHGSEILVAGDFNANLEEPEGTTCVEEIMSALIVNGME